MGVVRAAERTKPAARVPPGGASLGGAFFGGVVLLGVAVVVSRAWLLDPAPFFAERDAGFNAVGLDNLRHALLGDGDWRHAPLAWPLPNGTTQADWMFGQALLTLPLSGWVDPSRVYELACFAGLVLTAWAGMALARLLVGPGPHTWLAGLVVGLGPLQLAHAAHANLVHHELAVLAPLLLGIGLWGGRVGPALAGGLLLAGSFHFGLYIGLHALLGGAVVAGACAFGAIRGVRGGRDAARAWVVAGGGLGLGLLSVVPPGLLYLRASGGTSIPRPEVVEWSWDPASSFALVDEAPLHVLLGRLAPDGLLHGREMPNPGFVVLGLAIVGLARWRSVRAAVPLLVAAAVGAALALGPEPRVWGHALPVPGPSRLLELVVGENLREPRRWLFWAQVAAAVFASAGLARLLAPLPGVARPFVAGAVLLVAVGELPARVPEPAPAAREGMCLLDAAPEPGPLFEAFGRCNCSGALRLRAALFHRRPLVGGNFARFSEPLRGLNQLTSAFPSAAAVELLGVAQVRTTLEHPPLRGPPPEGAVCTERDGHRLCTLPARAPIPAPSVVTEEGTGPVIGVRWPDPGRLAEGARGGTAGGKAGGERGRLAATPVGAGPAGAKVAGVAGMGPAVRIGCGDEPPRRYSVATWQVLAQARGVGALDVFLDAPCEGVVVTDPPGGVPLFLRGEDPGWLPPVPAPGPGMDAMFHGACGEAEE